MPTFTGVDLARLDGDHAVEFYCCRLPDGKLVLESSRKIER